MSCQSGLANDQLLSRFQSDVVPFLKIDRCFVPAVCKRILSNESTLYSHPKELPRKLKTF